MLRLIWYHIEAVLLKKEWTRAEAERKVYLNDQRRLSLIEALLFNMHQSNKLHYMILDYMYEIIAKNEYVFERNRLESSQRF